MNITAPPSGLYPEDYDRIEAAVMETVRGRWFLLEFARRQRATETERLVQAVDRLERYAARRAHVVDMWAETPEAEPATEWRLPQRLAERAQEFARTLRASGLDEALCAQADALAEDFAKLAGTHSGIAEESGVVVRLPMVVAPPIHDVAPLEIEAAEVESLRADVEAEDWATETPDVDVTLEAEEAEAEEIDAGAFEMRASEPELASSIDIVAADPRLAALSRLDHLSLHEKLRLFG